MKKKIIIFIAMVGFTFFIFTNQRSINQSYCIPAKAIVFMDSLKNSRTAYPIGIETIGDTMTPLFDKYVELPNVNIQIFSTAEDNQVSISLHYLEGVHKKASLCRSLGRVDIKGLRISRAGVPKIKVITSILKDGAVVIKAIEKPMHYLEVSKSQSSSK